MAGEHFHANHRLKCEIMGMLEKLLCQKMPRHSEVMKVFFVNADAMRDGMLKSSFSAVNALNKS